MTRNARVDPINDQAAVIEDLVRRLTALEARQNMQLIARFPQVTQPVTPAANTYGGGVASTAPAATGSIDFTFKPNRKYWVTIFARAITCNASTINSGAFGLFDGSTNLTGSVGGNWHFMVPTGTSAEHAQAWGTALIDGPTSGDGTRYTALHWRVGLKIASNVFLEAVTNTAGIWDAGPLLG